MNKIILLLLLISCSKPEEQIPENTIDAVRFYCEDKLGPLNIIRLSKYHFRLECRNKDYLYFSHGDILFGPKKGKDHE